MKKLAKILTAAALCVAALTTFGCGDDKKEAAKAPAGDAPIKIAVTAGPHAEIMDNVKKLAEKQGLKIEVVGAHGRQAQNSPTRGVSIFFI